MTDWLAERTAVSPKSIALIISDQQWTYTELNTAVSVTTTHLHKNGIQPGTHLAILMPNSFTTVCLIHAAARLGAVLIPLNIRLTAAELAWQIQQADATTLVVDKTFAEMGKELEKEAKCQLLMVNSQLSMGETPSSLTVDNWQLTINNSPPSLQAIVFTSGTTGHPKGAMITFDNHFTSAMASAYRLGLDVKDRWLSVLPLYHVGGLAVIFRSCLYGTAVILHPRFHLDTINHSLDRDQPTLISLVPTMLYRLLNTRTNWPAGLRLILLGGAAATPELVEAANKIPRKLPIVKDRLSIANVESLTIDNRQLTIDNSPPPLLATTYGLTEAASQVTTQTPKSTAHKPGSVGKPLLFTKVEIVDENGRLLPQGEYGEIVVSGPTVMRGYYNNPEATAQVLRNGRLHTGDIGYLDEDGDLWLVQRRSDIIISGGENVYPKQVEQVLEENTAVSAACVVGIPDPEWGQKVVAMVQRMPKKQISEKELIAFSREQLAGYKQPRHIHFVDKLPLTASGKIHRKAVADRLQNIFQSLSLHTDGGNTDI
ncbi:MAG: 2-succinylbenzoate--CoA ligase [Chloroflexi bacterium]|nr:MAG: 2-succinylbenzoate--CoA ligase [Chloroflexota bacterium]